MAVLEQDGVSPQNLTGYVPEMIIKASSAAADDTGTTPTIGNGLQWTSQAGGTLTAEVAQAVLASPGFLWWRLDVIQGGERTTAMYGPLIVAAV